LGVAVKASVVCVIVVMATVAMNAGWRSENTMETQLTALEKSFSAAIVSNDPSAIERFLATDWVIIDPDGGVIERSRFLDVIRSGALKHHSMSSEDIRVLVYGDTAVVTALTSTKGAFMGQEFATKERATDVFVKRGGQWECVLSQLTRFSKKQGE
jgi:ketosteroid isomerase-like protein